MGAAYIDIFRNFLYVLDFFIFKKIVLVIIDLYVCIGIESIWIADKYDNYL